MCHFLPSYQLSFSFLFSFSVCVFWANMHSCLLKFLSFALCLCALKMFCVGEHVLVCGGLLILCLLFFFSVIFVCSRLNEHLTHFIFGLSLSVCFVSGCVSVLGLAGFKGLNVNPNRAKSILLWCLSLSILFLWMTHWSFSCFLGASINMLRMWYVYPVCELAVVLEIAIESPHLKTQSLLELEFVLKCEMMSYFLQSVLMVHSKLIIFWPPACHALRLIYKQKKHTLYIKQAS